MTKASVLRLALTFNGVKWITCTLFVRKIELETGKHAVKHAWLILTANNRMSIDVGYDR